MKDILFPYIRKLCSIKKAADAVKTFLLTFQAGTDTENTHLGIGKFCTEFHGIHALGYSIDHMLCSVALANDFFTGNTVHNGQDHGIRTDTIFHGVQCFGESCGFDCHNDQISRDSLGGRHTGEG